MNQEKIGKFIAKRRKAAKLTQAQLAEHLNITDRAVSKWENGRSMPDASVMLELCDVLKISVNDLLCGEVVAMDNYNKELENNLLEMIKQKDETSKRLLKMEVVLGVIAILPLIAAVVIASIVPMEGWKGGLLVGLSLLPLLIATPFALRIEQKAGYYKCAKCGHKYVPTFKSVLWAPHINRTRYMKCPECGEKSWNKKVLTKD